MQVFTHPVFNPRRCKDPGRCQKLLPAGSGKKFHCTNFPYHGLYTPTAVTVLLVLRWLSAVYEVLTHRALKFAPFYVTGTLFGYCVLSMTKTWSQLLNSSCTDGIENAFTLHTSYAERKAHSAVLSKCPGVLSSL